MYQVLLNNCQKISALRVSDFLQSDIVNKYIADIMDLNEEEGVHRMVIEESLPDITE